MLTEEEKKLLKRYLEFMSGFSESNLFEDYMAWANHENDPDEGMENGYTDDEYIGAMSVLGRLAK